MWRESAIRTLLLEEICHLPRSVEADGDSDDDRRLAKAQRRAALVVALDWTALLVLFVLRASERPWLPLGPSEESIFTFGILALAIHSGFRLGQLEKLRSVTHLLDELRDRAGGG